FFIQAEDGIRDPNVTGVQTCAPPICDRAGNTFAERLRAAATGLYAAAERMGERLRGIAEDVFAYATGQRDAERAGHAVESAGAALERADRTLEPVIQRELEIREERLIQEREHVLSLERERQ